MEGATMAQATDQTVDQAVVLYENDATQRAIEDIRNGRALAYSSIEGTSPTERLEVLELITSSEPVREHLNELVYVENIIIQRVEMADQQTGEMVTQPRIVFAVRQGKPDGDAIALHAISQGLLRSVNNLLGVLDRPASWAEQDRPAAKFKLVGPAGRQYLTMVFGKAALSGRK